MQGGLSRAPRTEAVEQQAPVLCPRPACCSSLASPRLLGVTSGHLRGERERRKNRDRIEDEATTARHHGHDEEGYRSHTTCCLVPPTSFCSALASKRPEKQSDSGSTSGPAWLSKVECGTDHGGRACAWWCLFRGNSTTLASPIGWRLSKSSDNFFSGSGPRQPGQLQICPPRWCCLIDWFPHGP
jgi:hypothetical protein